LGLFLAPQLLLFKVAQNGRTLLIDPNRCGKTSLDLLVAEPVQLFCEEVYALDGRRPPGNPTRPQAHPARLGENWPGGMQSPSCIIARQHLKMLIRLEGAHAFHVSIFGGVEHLR
jgi:hypothetical protein